MAACFLIRFTENMTGLLMERNIKSCINNVYLGVINIRHDTGFILRTSHKTEKTLDGL